MLANVCILNYRWDIAVLTGMKVCHRRQNQVSVCNHINIPTNKHTTEYTPGNLYRDRSVICNQSREQNWEQEEAKKQTHYNEAHIAMLILFFAALTAWQHLPSNYSVHTYLYLKSASEKKIYCAQLRVFQRLQLILATFGWGNYFQLRSQPFIFQKRTLLQILPCILSIVYFV